FHLHSLPVSIATIELSAVRNDVMTSRGGPISLPGTGAGIHNENDCYVYEDLPHLLLVQPLLSGAFPFDGPSGINIPSASLKEQCKGNCIFGSCDKHQLHIAQIPEVEVLHSTTSPILLTWRRDTRIKLPAPLPGGCINSMGGLMQHLHFSRLRAEDTEISCTNCTNHKQQDSHLRLTHHAQEKEEASSREEKRSRHRLKHSGNIYTPSEGYLLALSKETQVPPICSKTDCSLY
ncbi:Hypothetical predicted protein, partial [Pelobates cultripes]